MQYETLTELSERNMKPFARNLKQGHPTCGRDIHSEKRRPLLSTEKEEACESGYQVILHLEPPTIDWINQAGHVIIGTGYISLYSTSLLKPFHVKSHYGICFLGHEHKHLVINLFSHIFNEKIIRYQNAALQNPGGKRFMSIGFSDPGIVPSSH